LPATATHRPDREWELGVYHRGSQQPLDPGDRDDSVARVRVCDLGEWGPIMNGGAWLTIDNNRVDLLYRDLDTVERWLDDAQRGRFDVLFQNGHVAGAPAAQAASCPGPSSPPRWRKAPRSARTARPA
jgi:hypothetical protein